MRVAPACLENISPYQFWSTADRYPELVSHLHVHIKLMGYFGPNGGVPWLTNTDSEFRIFCEDSVEDVSHFLVDCNSFNDNSESFWSNLRQIIIACNPSEGTYLLRRRETL